MPRPSLRTLFGVASLILFGGQPAWGEVPAAPSHAAGALADYVAHHDDAYGWKVRRRGTHGQGSYAELILTSQRWRENTWRHQLFVYKPAEVRDPERALLLIGGGAWRDELADPATPAAPLPREAALLTMVADQLQTPVALVMQVPHQPIFGDLREDAAISYTFQEFFRTGDATWPLLLPMVKSAVRAMDCVAEFGAQEWKIAPAKFTVTGASKRGWTTWLTAAVDPRVDCLAPMVIDMLNLDEHIKLQLTSWGRYSDEIHDYTERGLQEHLRKPDGAKLIDIVDPYRYRESLRKPKLLLLGTNDKYWPLESLNLYWDGLVGEKYVVYVPNNGHGLHDFARVLGGVGALHRHAAGTLTMPKLAWQYAETPEGAQLTMRSDRKPIEVSVWRATSASRDFRDSVWSSEPVEPRDGEYQAVTEKPAAGCAAMFCEAKYADDVLPYYLSTTIKVVDSPAKRKPR